MKVSNGHLGDPEHPPCDRKAYALGIPHATVKEPSPSVPKSEKCEVGTVARAPIRQRMQRRLR